MFAVSLLGTWPPSGVSEAELSVAFSSPCIVFDPCFRNLSGQCALNVELMIQFLDELRHCFSSYIWNGVRGRKKE